MAIDCMDLSLMGRQARHNSERWFPGLHYSNEDLRVFYSLALAGEVGELCNIVKKYVRTGNETRLREGGIGSELADIFTYLLLLCDELKIDLFAEFEAKQAICEARWGNK
jgi:NTP pyrophosphatase (non-canonical NTP hydrolase)